VAGSIGQKTRGSRSSQSSHITFIGATFSKTHVRDVILPSKHIPANRALLTVGAEILKSLERPKSVSMVWDGLLDDSESGGLFGFRFDYDLSEAVLDQSDE